MTRSKHSFNDIQESFREWLIQSGLSEKLAGDVLSRCRRIERELSISLIDLVETKEKYLILMTRIHSFSFAVTITSKAAYAIRSNFYRASRLFAKFVIGDTSSTYPNGYTFRKIKATPHD